VCAPRDPPATRLAAPRPRSSQADTQNTHPAHPRPPVEWEEWGNPQDPEYYAYMKSYSPVDNVKAQRWGTFICVCPVCVGGGGDPKYYACVKSYSPLDNVKAQRYACVYVLRVGG
jgi:protease II